MNIMRIRKQPWSDKVNDAKKADRNIKYCSGCKRCWEQELKESSYGSRILYYKNFVSFGKEKKICKLCIGEIT